jgi:hypothetical protein
MSIGDELARLNARAECESHISELRQWLSEHLAPSTLEGCRARKDRLLSLKMWLGRLSIINRKGKL